MFKIKEVVHEQMIMTSPYPANQDDYDSFHTGNTLWCNWIFGPDIDSTMNVIKKSVLSTDSGINSAFELLQREALYKYVLLLYSIDAWVRISEWMLSQQFPVSKGI